MSLLVLLALHHLGDTIQPSWLIQNKKRHWFAVYEHAFAWTAVISLGLHLFGLLQPWKIVFLLVGHFVIDLVKYQYVPRRENYNWIYLDQLLHYAQVFVVWVW